MGTGDNGIALVTDKMVCCVEKITQQLVYRSKRTKIQNRLLSNLSKYVS
jgi:hypothetical protein